MSESASVWFMIGLNMVMVIYTLWVLSLGKSAARLRIVIGTAMVAWLALLHLGLSTKSIFPADISGVVFLMIIFLFVGVVASRYLCLHRSGICFLILIKSNCYCSRVFEFFSARPS